MSRKILVALDGMGGDNAPDAVVRGADIARERYPEAEFLLFGEPQRLQALVDKTKLLKGCCTVVAAMDVVSNDDKPAQALRRRRDSSMWLAVQSVADKRADCVVSAGNTGALMAIAKFVLRTLADIDRPALASFMPTMRGETVMLDLGANIQCDANNLVEFAVMGSAFARSALAIERPSVGLLNVGSEEMKGNDAVRAAASILRAPGSPVAFHGFVEGNDIGAGVVDVVATDGFTGNVALKAIEGTAKLYTDFVRNAFRTSTLAKIGYVLASGAWKKLRKRTDPRRYNGGVFLGLNGVCVKSHGGADAVGFAYAIGVAIDLVKHDFVEHVVEDVRRLRAAAPVATVSL